MGVREEWGKKEGGVNKGELARTRGEGGLNEGGHRCAQEVRGGSTRGHRSAHEVSVGSIGARGEAHTVTTVSAVAVQACTRRRGRHDSTPNSCATNMDSLAHMRTGREGE